MDRITITGLQVFAYHGVLIEEQEKGQEFSVNAVLHTDCRQPGKSDRLGDALDYAEACRCITEAMKEKRFDLIEAACEHVCEKLLTSFERLSEVEVELCKPHAPIGLPVENVSVTMRRGWHRAYLSIGSNLGDREHYIRLGVTELRKHPLVRGVVMSSVLETEPYGYEEQDKFLNAAIECDTLLEPEELLELLHEIEFQAGRERQIHWGPRTLDLDILFYDKLVYESRDLVIPHVDMENRLFVLEPLCELCPALRHPLFSKTVEQMKDELVLKTAQWKKGGVLQ